MPRANTLSRYNIGGVIDDTEDDYFSRESSIESATPPKDAMVKDSEIT